ncbi:MAG: pyrroline-5-carboxylate reductase [Spirochaetia bacterium]
MGVTGIIGAGNMGFALVKGLKRDNSEREILIFDQDIPKAERAAEECQCIVASSLEEIFRRADITVVAIKPQHLAPFFRDASKHSKNQRIISIVAGKPIELFKRELGTSEVIRFMPNLAATVSASVVGVASPEGIDEAFRAEALTIAEALGTAVPLPEELLSSITGLSGSGIAFVFAFIHAMALGGTQAGIPYDTSLEIAEHTLHGALEVLKNENSTPSEMLTRVTSAGGTTIEGVRALEEGGLTPAVMEAIMRAKKRAEELEGE